MTQDESVQANLVILNQDTQAAQVKFGGQCFQDGAGSVVVAPPSTGGTFTQADIDAAVKAAKDQAALDQDAAVAAAVAAEKAKIVGEAQPLIDELKS